jgi:AcrR family transcriptional regulator
MANTATTRAAEPTSRRPRRSGRPTLVEAARLDARVRESALQLFLERGYEGTSMDEIARAAGTTKVSLYARFASKDEVFNAVFLWATRRADWPRRESIPPDLDDLEGALMVIGESSVRRALDPAMVRLSRIAAAHALRFPEIARRTHASGYSPRHQLLIELLQRHAARGAIIADDLDIMAEHFLAMVSAMPSRLASFGIMLTPAAQRRRIEVAVQLFLRALRPAPAAVRSERHPGARTASSGGTSR